MSEYIYKLADDAGAEEYQLINDGEFHYCLVDDEAILNFAKSIIEQCGDFTDPITRKLMKKHFGIE